MADMLRLAGLISLFLGGTMFFSAFMGEKSNSFFAFQFILSPILMYFGFKLLL